MLPYCKTTVPRRKKVKTPFRLVRLNKTKESSVLCKKVEIINKVTEGEVVLMQKHDSIQQTKL